jgi:hypothetical protein
VGGHTKYYTAKAKAAWAHNLTDSILTKLFNQSLLGYRTFLFARIVRIISAQGKWSDSNNKNLTNRLDLQIWQ